jgi:hypothetical protein
MVNHQAIADALGDTIKIFLEHYAPWIAEFEQAHADAQRKDHATQSLKSRRGHPGAEIPMVELIPDRVIDIRTGQPFVLREEE